MSPLLEGQCGPEGGVASGGVPFVVLQPQCLHPSSPAVLELCGRLIVIIENDLVEVCLLV